ncbi:MAG: RNA 2',3'-cyclic phosphodiesterase [Clostridia bacterium]|nr:RNA 2',3'-cyclic phosphodiesterase [Clostridia bacterium]
MRLFAALQPSPEFREELSKLQQRLRAAGIGGRYLDPVNLHLTLAFIGEWPQNVTEYLPAVGTPFPIALSHIGVFQRAKVLWAGIEPSQRLNDLAALVRKNLRDAGIPYDPQDFNPHITLIRKPVLPDEALLNEIKPMPAAMMVQEICLYQSEHTENGMAYTVIGRKKGTA